MKIRMEMMDKNILNCFSAWILKKTLKNKENINQ